MTLAFQCGEWDWRALAEKMDVRTFEGWLTWFRRRPQGQYHRDNMLAFSSSLICAAHGADFEPAQFMYYEKATKDEVLSVDDAWSQVSSLIPVATKPIEKTTEEKPNA